MAVTCLDNSLSIKEWIQKFSITDKEALVEKLYDLGIYNTAHLIQFPVLHCQMADLGLQQYDEITLFESLMNLVKDHPIIEERLPSSDYDRQTIREWMTSEVQIEKADLINRCVGWLLNFDVRTVSDLRGFKFKYQLLTSFSLKLYEKFRLMNTLNLLMKRRHEPTDARITMTEESSVTQHNLKEQSSGQSQQARVTQVESENPLNTKNTKPTSSTDISLHVEMVGIPHPVDNPGDSSPQEAGIRNEYDKDEISQQQPENDAGSSNIHVADVDLETPKSPVPVKKKRGRPRKNGGVLSPGVSESETSQQRNKRKDRERHKANYVRVKDRPDYQPKGKKRKTVKNQSKGSNDRDQVTWDSADSGNNTERALDDPQQTPNDNESLHPTVEPATSHKNIEVTEGLFASNPLNPIHPGKLSFVIEQNENGQGISSDIPSKSPRLPEMMYNSQLSTHPLTPGQDMPTFSPIRPFTTTERPKTLGHVDVPFSCKIGAAQNFNNSIEHQKTQGSKYLPLTDIQKPIQNDSIKNLVATGLNIPMYNVMTHTGNGHQLINQTQSVPIAFNGTGPTIPQTANLQPVRCSSMAVASNQNFQQHMELRVTQPDIIIPSTSNVPGTSIPNQPQGKMCPETSRPRSKPPRAHNVIESDGSRTDNPSGSECDDIDTVPSGSSKSFVDQGCKPGLKNVTLADIGTRDLAGSVVHQLQNNPADSVTVTRVEDPGTSHQVHLLLGLNQANHVDSESTNSLFSNKLNVPVPDQVTCALGLGNATPQKVQISDTYTAPPAPEINDQTSGAISRNLPSIQNGIVYDLNTLPSSLTERRHVIAGPSNDLNSHNDFNNSVVNHGPKGMSLDYHQIQMRNDLMKSSATTEFNNTNGSYVIHTVNKGHPSINQTQTVPGTYSRMGSTTQQTVTVQPSLYSSMDNTPHKNQRQALVTQRDVCIPSTSSAADMRIHSHGTICVDINEHRTTQKTCDNITDSDGSPRFDSPSGSESDDFDIDRCSTPKPFVDAGCQRGVKTEWKVDVQSDVCRFDITQTREIICCTWDDVGMLSAVGKQVSVPFDTSDIKDPRCVAVNQQTGDVIITQYDSRDWFVYIKEGAEWRQKVYSLGEKWGVWWWRRHVSWTPTGQVVMVLYKDGKPHIVKYNKEDGQQVWSCPAECDSIADITVDSRGYIYCCDIDGDCVRVYNTEGSLSHTVPRDPDTVHTLLRPVSICVDSRDRLLVLHKEKAGLREPRVVTLWSSDGTYITKLLDNVDNVICTDIRLHNDQTLVMLSGPDIRSYNISSALQAV